MLFDARVRIDGVVKDAYSMLTCSLSSSYHEHREVVIMGLNLGIRSRVCFILQQVAHIGDFGSALFIVLSPLF